MRNALKPFLFSGLLSVLFACGGGGSTPPPLPPPPLPTPLTVLSVNPMNNAIGVPVTTNIVFTFSASLDTATVMASSVELLKNNVLVPAAVATSGATVTLTPSAPLDYSSVYTTKITTAVKNTSGTPLATQFTSSFTTVAAPPPVPPPFALDTQYLMDSVTTDEVGNVYVVGRVNTTPTNIFVAKFDATGKLTVLNSNLGLASGFYPYGKIYVRSGYCYVPVTSGTAQSTAIAKISADTMSLLLFGSISSTSKPAIALDGAGHQFITSWSETEKTDMYFALSSSSDISYTGGTAITLVPNGVVVAGKTNSVVSLTFRDANFVTKWNEVSATSGYDARNVSYASGASMLFVSGSTFDATVTNGSHFPFVKGYTYQSADPLNALTLAWTTLLAGTDMTDATGASDGSQYAICTGPDTLTKVRVNGTTAWNMPLSKKPYGVAEYNSTVYVVDESSAIHVFDGLTGLPR